jgi:hypothetical protein
MIILQKLLNALSILINLIISLSLWEGFFKNKIKTILLLEYK